jgi:hypothetical protein
MCVSGTYICILGTGHGEGFLYSDIDGVTRKNVSFQNKKSITLTMHNCMVWDMSTSPLHGVIASSASDGTVMVKPYSSTGYTANPKHKVRYVAIRIL